MSRIITSIVPPVLLVCAALMVPGCDTATTPATQGSATYAPEAPVAPPVDAPAPNNAAPVDSADTTAMPTPADDQAAGAAAPAAGQPAPDAAAPETVREQAQAGVGEKGSTLNYELGTTAAKVYFVAKERVVFDIQIPQAMQLYKAENGAAPKTEEEFMEKIIKNNQIQLPQLPAGHRYVYDPQTEELMVEHPRGQ